jgi:hypothetical protein
MSHMDPVHNVTSNFLTIFLPTSHLRQCLHSSILPSLFLTKILYAFLVFSVCAACTTHFNIIDIVALIIFVEECRWRRYWVCNFRHSSNNSTLLVPTLFSYLFSLTSLICVLSRRAEVYGHIEQQVKFMFLADGKIKYSEMDGSKYSPDIIYS